MTGLPTVRSLRGIVVAGLKSRAASLVCFLAAVFACAVPPALHAQTEGFKILYSFTKSTDGAYPYRGLIQASDGNFYGTDGSFGAHSVGVVYCVSLDGTQTVLHSFTAPDANGINPDGAYPYDKVIQGTDGNFYGTAPYGGAHANGTIFKLTPAGVFTTLYSFGAVDANTANTDGARPYCSLIQAKDGNFYGVTIHGGVNGSGVVFKITPSGAYTNLHSFAALDSKRANLDGAYPDAGLIQAADGNFYGTANGGGANGTGTIFKISATGSFSTLHVFTALEPNAATNADGADPACALVQTPDGALYGTAYVGGANARGTIFKITTGGTFSTEYTISVTNTFGFNYDGVNPNAGLLLGTDGHLYGTTYGAGIYGSGTVFSVVPGTGRLVVLHPFDTRDLSSNTNDDGAQPFCKLIQGLDGAIYGTASNGGPNNAGTVFSLTLPLHAFDEQNIIGANANYEGKNPASALIEGSDGNLYGTNVSGGVNAAGTVFRMSRTGGGFKVLHAFAALSKTGTNTDGANPLAPLVLGKDGNYYGTAGYGGANSTGTIFKLTPAGVFSVVHTFTALESRVISAGTTRDVNAEGAHPNGALLPAPNGTLYGTAFNGGNYGAGTVFTVGADGTVVFRYAFNVMDDKGLNGDGGNPYAAVVEDGAGNLLGTNGGGGGYGTGTVFMISAAGAYSVLHTFGSLSTDGNNTNADGAFSRAALVQGRDGDFYGTASGGGAKGKGVVFRVGADRSFGVVHTFTAVDAANSNGDGATPYSPLLQSDDGNFYGTAQYGGSNGQGTVFSVSPTGTFTTFPVLADPLLSGANPTGGLLAGSDGYLYGTGTFGGVVHTGVIFRFTPHQPEIISSTAATATVGSAFSYGIRVTGTAVRYEAYGLPAGLKLNQATGAISGAPAKAGTFAVTLAAFNALGTDYATLTLTVKGTAPVITSATAASGQVGKVFSYTIAATNSPTSYGESGIPSGLTINQSTGVISGTPKTAGTYTVTIAAFKSSGHGTATLTLTVKPAAPVVTSATTAAATVGKAFSYQITATNSPTSYGESGIPTGLSISQSTGKISGTPTKAGTYTVTIAAFNAGGSGSAKLTLTVKAVN